VTADADFSLHIIHSPLRADATLEERSLGTLGGVKIRNVEGPNSRPGVRSEYGALNAKPERARCFKRYARLRKPQPQIARRGELRNSECRERLRIDARDQRRLLTKQHFSLLPSEHRARRADAHHRKRATAGGGKLAAVEIDVEVAAEGRAQNVGRYDAETEGRLSDMHGKSAWMRIAGIVGANELGIAGAVGAPCVAERVDEHASMKLEREAGAGFDGRLGFSRKLLLQNLHSFLRALHPGGKRIEPCPGLVLRVRATPGHCDSQSDEESATYDS
jgi:hypothetical protein